jgi:hypothetical protein
MGRMYTTKFKGVAITAAQDLFEILAASGKGIFIHGFALSQSTEEGDAQSEMLQLTTNRGVGSVTSGSGGSTDTPNPIQDADSNSGATVEINNTTRMVVGSGTLEELEVHCWNVQIPYIFWYTPETRPYVAPGNRWTLELEDAPADSITASGTVWFEEHG